LQMAREAVRTRARRRLPGMTSQSPALARGASRVTALAVLGKEHPYDLGDFLRTVALWRVTAADW
jgi:hypothetical protein